MPDTAERPQVLDDRRTKILDAVGEIVVERGIAGLTTALVARRARIAPGKFYELYSDKYAVLQAAANRNLRRFYDLLAEELDDRGDVELPELGRITLDIWVRLCREDPAFRVLRFWRAPDVVAAEGADADSRAVRVWAAFLQRSYGLDNTPELRKQMTLAVKFALDAIEYAFVLDPDGDPEVLDQVGRVLDFHFASA